MERRLAGNMKTWFTGKRDSDFDRHWHFCFSKGLGPLLNQWNLDFLLTLPDGKSYLRFVAWLVLWLFWLWLTSICLTSPFHLQPSGELGHVTTRERTSRFIKLSWNICIQIKETFSLKKSYQSRSSTWLILDLLTPTIPFHVKNVSLQIYLVCCEGCLVNKTDIGPIIPVNWKIRNGEIWMH